MGLSEILARAIEKRKGSGESPIGSLTQKLVLKPRATPEPAAPRTLRQKFADAAGTKDPVAYREINRIIALPVVDGFPPEEREKFQRENVLAAAYAQGFRLHDVQVDAVLTFTKYRSLFAPIGVGWGKTLITQMIPGKAAVLGMKKTLLLIPSQVYAQFMTRDVPFARGKIALHGTQFYGVNGTATMRRTIAASGRAGCYVMPYSILSTKDGLELMQMIRPDVVICDEAHSLRSYAAARTRRFIHYMAERAKEGTKPAIVALSGTITAKSVMDYHHFIAHDPEYCPLPVPRRQAEQWAAVLDAVSGGGETVSADVGPITPLLDWAIKQPAAPDCPYNSTGFRRAYQHRLRTAPTTVGTGDADIGTSLIVRTKHIPLADCRKAPGWAELSKLRTQVADAWQSPDGDDIEFAMHKFRWLYELSSGFYNSLVWPTVELLAERRKLSLAAAEDLLLRAKTHHAAVQAYHRQLRSWLQTHTVAGVDTPMLVAASMAKHDIQQVKDQALYDLWCQARSLKTPDLPERDSVVKRVCPYKIDRACEWADEMGHGIIWFHHNGMGDWLHEVLPEATYCPAGDWYNKRILNTEDEIVIASITAHGTGKNLQFHRNQLFLQFPRPAQAAEQAIGRTHRIGQQADEIIVDRFVAEEERTDGGIGESFSFDELCFAACLNDALYIHQTTGSRQKLIYCDYTRPGPRVFPSQYLAERGFDPQQLTPEQQRALVEKFQGD